MKVKLLRKCRRDMRIVKVGSTYCFQRYENMWETWYTGELKDMLKIMHMDMKRRLISSYELVKHKVIC
jgi:hypothetical protein